MMILIIFIFGLFLRIYLLDKIPGEMWGDVIEHYKLTKLILEKRFYISYLFGGDGLLISYLNAIFTKFFGLSFYSLKLTTAVIGSFIILINFFITKELFKNKEIGYIASFITAVGFWGLTFSRQAKPYILAGLFISLVIYFLIKKRYVILGLVLGLGLYSQSSFWGMMFLSFINYKTFLITSFLSLPFFLNLFKNKEIFFSQYSYLGEKLIGSYNLGMISYFKGIIFNYFRNIFGLFFSGDVVFRHNIPFSPHLDFIMQFFLIIGIYFFIKKYLIKKSFKYYLIIILIFLIYLPTCLDVKNILNNPSMGRTVGSISIFYPIISLGIYEFINIFKNKILKKILFMIILFTIFLINFYQYYYIYPQTLPEKNFPLSRLTGEIIDKYRKEIPLIINNCCWLEWGMPEPYSIIFNLKNNRKYYINNIDFYNDFSYILKYNNYVILIDRPDNDDFLKLESDKFEIVDFKSIKKENRILIKVFLIKNKYELF